MSLASSASTPPGWYPDPEGRPEKRWWNGSTWTGSYAPVVAAAVPAPALAEKPSTGTVAETMQLTSASQLSSLPSGPGYASLLAALPAVPVWVEPTTEPASATVFPTFAPAPSVAPTAPGAMAGPPAMPGLAALPAYASNGTAMPSPTLPSTSAPLAVQNPQLALASSSPAPAAAPTAPAAFAAPAAPAAFSAPASWGPPIAAPQAVHTQQQFAAQPAFTPPTPTPAPSYAQAVPLTAPAPAPTAAPRPAQQFPQSAPSFIPAEPSFFVPTAPATSAPVLSYVAPSYSPPQSAAVRTVDDDGPKYQPFGMISAVRTGPVGPPEIAYTTSVWIQALLPLLVVGSAVSLVLFLPDFYSRFVQYGLLAVLVIGTIALAISDYRTLREAGHTRAAYPAWVLLSPLVYLGVRAARTKDEAQKGIAPLLVWLLAMGIAAALWFLIPNWASELLITPAD